MEQYYHAPGKLSTMVLEVARARHKHALNALYTMIFMPPCTGWTMLMGRDAQQAATRR